MKLLNITFGVILLMAFTNIARGQYLITRSDSISIQQDTIVKLVVPNYRGNIVWQKSPDGIYWNTLSDATSDTLLVKSETEAMYRAMVMDGNCLPVFSDTAVIVRNDTISTNIIIPSNSGSVLVSDSIEISEGKYVYIDKLQETDFETGKIIIDSSNRSLRKITDLIKKGDTITAKTEQATLEDIFQDVAFKLSTSMMPPAQKLKSASMTELTKALTDADGYIHPISISYHREDGTVLKKASVLDNGASTSDNALFWHKDFDFILWDFSGKVSLPLGDGTFIDYTGTSKSFITDSYITLDPEFKFEFEFNKPKFSWDDVKFTKGELKVFKFYSDESIFDFKFVHGRESNISYSIGKSMSFLPQKVIIKATYPIGLLPLHVDFELDLKMDIRASIGPSGTILKGFQNKTYVTLGLGYEKQTWYPINDVYSQFTPISTSNYQGNFEVRVDIYPSFNIKFYSTLGPYLEVGPYLKSSAKTSQSDNYEVIDAAGIDARVGVSAGILGYDFLKSELSLNLTEETIYKSPDKIELISGNNQESISGTKLIQPIKVRVMDSRDKPVKDVQVYFRPYQGIVDEEILRTDIEGYAETGWTMSNVPGINRMEVFLKNARDEDRHELKLDVRATGIQLQEVYKPVVSTFPPTSVSQTSAIFNGEVSSDGGSEIQERGFYWSNSINNPGPQNGSMKVVVDGKTGTYSYQHSGLQSNTTYFFTAYAKNSQGISTGESLSFRTSSSGSGACVDAEGYIYKTVQIGNQVWMAENLRTSKYRDGTTIPNVIDDSDWAAMVSGAYCFYNNDVSNKTTYGSLYNWYAVNTGKLCPTGWHVPSDDEWKQLEKTLGMTQDEVDRISFRGSEEGRHLKSPDGWISDVSGTNSTGFTAIPAGYRFIAFEGFGAGLAWWSSTQESEENAWDRGLHNQSNRIDRYAYWKYSGFSVRCVKD